MGAKPGHGRREIAPTGAASGQGEAGESARRGSQAGGRGQGRRGSQGDARAVRRMSARRVAAGPMVATILVRRISDPGMRGTLLQGREEGRKPGENLAGSLRRRHRYRVTIRARSSTWRGECGDDVFHSRAAGKRRRNRHPMVSGHPTVDTRSTLLDRDTGPVVRLNTSVDSGTFPRVDSWISRPVAC